MFLWQFSHLFCSFRSWARSSLGLESGFSCICFLGWFISSSENGSVRNRVLGCSDLIPQLPSSAYILPPCTFFFLNLPLNLHLNLYLISGCTKAGLFVPENPLGMECWGVGLCLGLCHQVMSVTGRKWVCKQASVSDYLKSSCCSPWKGSTSSPACKRALKFGNKTSF